MKNIKKKHSIFVPSIFVSYANYNNDGASPYAKNLIRITCKFEILCPTWGKLFGGLVLPMNQLFGEKSRQIQSRRLNAGASSLPHGVHMYALAYTLCPVQGLEMHG